MRHPRRAAVALLATLFVVTSPALAHRARPIRLKFPSFVTPPHSDREVCTFVRLPAKVPYDASGVLIVNLGGSKHFQTHHFLMYAYAGHSLGDFASLEGKIVDSKACIDFGPTDSTQRVLIGGSQQPRLSTRLPAGLAQQITPVSDAQGSAIGFILNSHWINGDDRPHRASVRIKFFPARPHTVKRFLQPIFEVVANAFLKATPGTTSTAAAWLWSPGSSDIGAGFGGVAVPHGPACVVMVTAHMHKRGKRFSVDFVERGGARTHLFDTEDYTDPGQWPPTTPRPGVPSAPLLVQPGQSLAYQCTHDNGVTTAEKLGCEEQPGVVPGLSIFESFTAGKGLYGAAKRCATDADCAGYGTGRCVPANLVFGFTSDDDMCILPGSYYDANVDAAPGQDPCDLSPLPVIN